MAWAITMKEINEKIERIKELTDHGFNTPKMFFLKKNSHADEVNNCLEWCEKIAHPIYNVRTYNYNQEQETIETDHHVDIKLEHLKKLIVKINHDTNCMVDAEIPDNGRWAGNVMIWRNNLGRPISADIDFCFKEKRAMVRDADKSMNVHALDFEIVDQPFKTVIKKAITFVKHGEVILEWTYFCDKAGILNENIVWWEYRSYRGV